MTQQEGFWRDRASDEISDLPWPEEGEAWEGQQAFVAQLEAVEATAHAASYRGCSICRLCGVQNGARTFMVGDWQWPSGYKHYLGAHNVRPTPAFRAMIESLAAK